MFNEDPTEEIYPYFADDDEAADEPSEEHDDRGSDPEPVQIGPIQEGKMEIPGQAIPCRDLTLDQNHNARPAQTALPRSGRAHWACAAKVLLAGAVLAAALAGQSFYGGVRGFVRDPNGGAIPKAKVTLVDQATKISRVTYSSDDGEYSFNQVIPSTYSLEAEASGFTRVERKDVPITTQPQIALDLGLQVGDVSQTVEVSAEVPLIETSNAQQGQAFSHEKLSQLPNFGRNPFGMGRLSQNVTPVGNPATNNMQTQSATALTSVAGGMLWQNSYIIDGVPSTAWFGLPLILPSLEAVAEMKVQVNHYDSEMGRTGGGVFNTILRSGTNDLHGSVYGHIRRTGMNANLYFNNAAGRPLSPNADDMGRQPRRSRLHSKGL